MSIRWTPDHARSERCRQDLHAFCCTYLPSIFREPFTPLQALVISEIRHAILHRGRAARAVDRAFGKTAISLGAALWAAVCGHAAFVVPILASERDVVFYLEELDYLLEDAAALRQDFPDIQPTRTPTTMRFPPVSASAPYSGIVIAPKPLDASSLTGLISGERRPDLFICDNPQTDESARSEVLTTRRYEVLRKATEGLTAGIVSLWTRIIPGDLADRYMAYVKGPTA